MILEFLGTRLAIGTTKLSQAANYLAGGKSTVYVTIMPLSHAVR